MEPGPDKAVWMAWWIAMSRPAQRDVMYHATTTSIATSWDGYKWVRIEDARE